MVETTKGFCVLCGHHCGHVFVPFTRMPKLVHELIDKLESGCGHVSDNTMCESCRKLIVTVLWQLQKGEAIG